MDFYDNIDYLFWYEFWINPSSYSYFLSLPKDILFKENNRLLAGVTFSVFSPSQNVIDLTPYSITFFFDFFGILKKKFNVLFYELSFAWLVCIYFFSLYNLSRNFWLISNFFSIILSIYISSSFRWELFAETLIKGNLSAIVFFRLSWCVDGATCPVNEYAFNLVTPLSTICIALVNWFLIILLSYKTYYFCWFLNIYSILGMWIYLFFFSFSYFSLFWLLCPISTFS